jgi:DNA repair protein RecN (Recombination protein N)
MIKQLSIQNFALIKQADLVFSKGLTVITGETGAGKSILLGALQLLLGARADAALLLNKQLKCVIEGYFEASSQEIQDFFKSEDFDYDALGVVIRRELLPNGKSRAFINDTPASLSQLKQLGNMLVDISAQHDTLEINTQAFQLDFVDAMANLLDQRTAMTQQFNRLQKLNATANELAVKQAERLKQQDYDQFLYDELIHAQLTDEVSLSQLENEFTVLTHATQLGESLQQLHFGLTEAENAPDQSLGLLLNQLNQLKKLDSRIEELYNRLLASRNELIDIARDAAYLQAHFVPDAERLHWVSKRIDLLNSLCQKHRVNSHSELIQIQEMLAEKLANSAENDQQLLALKQTIESESKALQQLASKISEARKAVLPSLSKQINALLPEMGMVHAHFTIDHSVGEKLHSGRAGYDQLRFLFSANQGSAPQEIHKVASGGELSRLMLAIKSLLHDRLALPTVVFDEIDTGISGETSLRIGRVLQNLAQKHQVILVTHLAQIAAKGDVHLFVAKESSGGQTSSKIRQLTQDERIAALAEMIGGANPGESAISHARELFHI